MVSEGNDGLGYWEDSEGIAEAVEKIGEDNLKALILNPSLMSHDEGGSIVIGTRVGSWVGTTLDSYCQSPGAPWKNRSVIVRTLVMLGLKVLAELDVKPGAIIDEVLFQEEAASRRLKESQTIGRAQSAVKDLEDSIQDFQQMGLEPRATVTVKNFLASLEHRLKGDVKKDYISVLAKSRIFTGFIRSGTRDESLREQWDRLTAVEESEAE